MLRKAITQNNQTSHHARIYLNLSRVPKKYDLSCFISARTQLKMNLEMNEHLKKTSINKLLNKWQFVLTRKNQKGQVAVFVALIFQVIFVFFALLINVGLLVHHKINLQQSTDLAAYYGAMKQAETLNAIAHINFQIKQAWKLLTWRYRILGTFGFTKGNTLVGTLGHQNFPFEFRPGPGFHYYGSAGTRNNKCAFPGATEPLGTQDIPFFCVGHSGFANWSQGESNCQLSCGGFSTARAIRSIPLPSGISVPGANIAGSVRAATELINTRLRGLCRQLGPTGATLLSRFIVGYVNETTPRLKTIELLAKNLSLAADRVLDIEGNTLRSGSLLTLKNNLTEANLSGFRDSNFIIENGLGSDTCKFTDGLNGPQFLRKIDFNFINYFIHNCTVSGSGPNEAFDYVPENVYDPNSATGLGSAFNLLSPDLTTVLESVLNPQTLHTIGFEKNPHCVEYYAVKASSEPQIPFLPLTKIKLNALAIAKPFGGNIGPWYGKTWPQGAEKSQYDDNNQTTKTDETLPIRDLRGATGVNDVTRSVYSQPNFSLYVGDLRGLRNSDYIAAYHSALAIRDIMRFNNSSSTNQNSNNTLSNNTGPSSPGHWPHAKNWNDMDNAAVADYRDYDSLASIDSEQDGMRALEITAIAPNQFDITHYSIDPDFYNNYYVKLAKTGLSKIKAATGVTMDDDWLRADFGAVRMRAENTSPESPLTPRTFSVKDQILLKNRVLAATPSIITDIENPNRGKSYNAILNHLVKMQSSLLTAWTFLNFSDYKTFPSGTVNNDSNTMSFGQCSDSWNNTAAAAAVANSTPTADEHFRTPPNVDPKFPPVPGNCVTGGRTGYSVKLVSPNMVRANSLRNPLADGFFSF